MAKRVDLDKKLREYYNPARVFFQPPENVKLSYPCVLYWLDDYDQQFADDITYIGKVRYSLRYITKDPDDERILGVLSKFNHIKLNNFFTADNLNHYDYSLYF